MAREGTGIMESAHLSGITGNFYKGAVTCLFFCNPPGFSVYHQFDHNGIKKRPPPSPFFFQSAVLI